MVEREMVERKQGVWRRTPSAMLPRPTADQPSAAARAMNALRGIAWLLSVNAGFSPSVPCSSLSGQACYGCPTAEGTNPWLKRSPGGRTSKKFRPPSTIGRRLDNPLSPLRRGRTPCASGRPIFCTNTGMSKASPTVPQTTLPCEGVEVSPNIARDRTGSPTKPASTKIIDR